MAQITLRLSDVALLQLQQLSAESNLTVTDYLLSRAIPGYIEDILTVDKILDKLDSFPAGEKFTFTAQVNTSASKGEVIATITLITNSPNRPLVNLFVTGKVQ